MRGAPGTPKPRRLLTLDGVTHPLATWARLVGMAPSTIAWRLNHGQTVEEALQPVRSGFVRAVEAYLDAQQQEQKEDTR